MKPHIKYEFHHTGIPTEVERPDEIFSPVAGMFTSNHAGELIQTALSDDEIWNRAPKGEGALYRTGA